MDEAHHLLVETGEEKGRRIVVPPAGGRLGRSSKNDIVIPDPLLSRHHCRLFFKPDEGLWITDLGSANQSLVKGQPAQETRVRPGDRIQVGDTILKVLSDAPAGQAEPAVVAAMPVVDLGFDSPPPPAARRRRVGTGPLIIVAVVAAVLALAAWLPKVLTPPEDAAPLPPPPPPPAPRTLAIHYEKIEADKENIFRYTLQLTHDRSLSVQIDDLGNDRHVRKEGRVDEAYAAELMAEIENAGFFGLTGNYEGIQPDVLDAWDLTITIGRNTHRVRVVNRLEPDAFQKTREMIEEFGKNELGLWAIQFSPEKLVEMARDAYLDGKKLYGEREVKYGNLATAIKRFSEAEMYLETVAPKPDFHGDIVADRAECKRELDEMYAGQKFRAERAIRLREWEEAQRELQVLCELIPDRSDARNKEARRELLEIERRLDR